jgi:hypothetical protein
MDKKQHGQALCASLVGALLALPGAAWAAAPVATADTATTAYQTRVGILVLANDSDPDGDALTLVGFPVKPAHGTVQRGTLRAFYTPAQGFSGQDSFTYRVRDATGLSSTATVTVTVKLPPNRKPVAVADSGSTGAVTAVTMRVLANDTDPDGDKLRVIGNTAPAHGSVTRTLTSLTYTPAAGFTGSDSFSYTIGDGRAGTATATVTVSVVAPVVHDSATLSWSVPTTRADGSPLATSEIAGYEIYMIAESTGLRSVITVSDSAATSHTVSGLPADTYHFSMVALDTSGNPSELSAVVSKTIAP